MKDRAVFVLILFFVFGSAAMSGSPSFSQTTKSIFNGTGLGVMGLIGIWAIYNLLRGRKYKF